MARMSIVTIYNRAASPADEHDLDQIAGIAPADVALFVDYVAAELAQVLGVPSAVARELIGYHVEAGVVRCRPIGTGGPSASREAELRSVARETALHIVGALRELNAKEWAA